MDAKKALGQALREIRKSKNITQKKAAEKMKTTQAGWSAYETGKNGTSLEIVVQLANAVEVPPITLMKKFLTYYLKE